MSTPPDHERVVARLLADARAVRPLWSPHTRLVLWLVVPLLILGVAVQFGLREDVGRQLRQPLFLLELGAMAAAGVIAAGVALRGAVPGTMSGRSTMVIFTGLVSAAVVLLSREPIESVRSVWGFVGSGGQCLLCLISFAALPWAVLCVALRRGAPLDGPVTGAYTGAAAFLFAGAAVRIACPIDEASHLVVWHTAPIAVGAVLSGVAGARWLDPCRQATCRTHCF